MAAADLHVTKSSMTKTMRLVVLRRLLLCLFFMSVCALLVVFFGHVSIDSVELSQFKPDQKMQVPVLVRNWSCRRYSIIGALGKCGPEGCSGAIGLPIELPAWGSVKVMVDLKCPSKADFDNTLELYVYPKPVGSTVIHIRGHLSSGNGT